MRITILAVFGLLASSLAYADPLQGIYQAYEDWVLACDNTGTCRAAGFSDDEVSLLLTRKGGTDADITATVFFPHQRPEKSDQSTAALIINHRPEGNLTNLSNGYFLLNEDQCQTILTALHHNEKIDFLFNGKNKSFSVTDSTVVLTKMDTFQQRSGKENLLFQKDNNNNTPRLPQDKPLIITQPVMTSPEIKSLNQQQLKAEAHWLPPEQEINCKKNDNDGTPLFNLIPVNNHYSLITMRCPDSTYTHFWLTDNQFKHSPRLITTGATEYQKGRIYRSAFPEQTWVWNGHDFILSNENYDNAKQGKALAFNGAWSIPVFISEIMTQQEVDTDNAALDKFYQVIVKEKITDPELDPENIAAHFPLTKPVTEFTIPHGENNRHPKTNVVPGITDDEWQAFLRSNIIVDSDAGNVKFKLIDLDGDGKRDLIISSSEEDSGFFSYTGVLKRGEREFYPPQPTQQDEDLAGSDALFSENEHGANQWSRWIEINGQVYALWINGTFGEDNLYLLRPFSESGKKPVVTVHYTYQFSDIDSEDDGQSPQSPIQDRDKIRLLEQVNAAQKRQQTPPDTAATSTSLCPVPPATAPEDTKRYSTGISLNSDYEHVADIPVWLNSTCYIGTLTSHFGAYEHGSGVDAEITLVSPEKDDDPISSYTLLGLRRVTSITKSYKNREGDEGYQENNEMP